MMKVTMWLWRDEWRDWHWGLFPTQGSWKVTASGYTYTTKYSAARAAKRAAQKLGIEIVEDGE
jgi:hypothetical protein